MNEVIPTAGMIRSQGISKIDLTKENTISVWYENMGNVDIQGVTIAVTMNGTLVETKAVDAIVKPEATGYMTFTLPTEGLTAGETAKVIATVTVENDGNEANNSLEQDYVIVDGETVEPTFTVAAENVTVPFGAQSFEISATITNTSEIDAQGLTVKLLKGIEEVETKGIDILLEAGKSTTVTFTIAAPEGGFVAGTAMYYVQAGNGQAEVEVTFEAEQPAEVVDMAITTIQGISKIDLTKENNISVWYENMGNVDIQGVTIAVTMNGILIETKAVDAIVKPEATGYMTFTLPTEGLVAGETAKVIATVTVENDGNEANNSFEQDYLIIDGETVEPTFTVAAENVTVPFGAQSFEISATITNTSEIDAQGLTVKLLKGIEVVETKGIDILLEAGKSTTVTFTIDAPEGGFVAGTAMYYVQAGNGQAEIEVTFEAEQPAGDVDLAITQISGDLSLKVESNRLGVWVENKGTADVKDADVALRYGDAIQPGTVSVKAGEGSFCWFTITAEELQAGEFTVTATVNAEGDIDDTNNTLSRTFNIAPVLTFAAEDISVDKDAESFTVAVTVNNPSNVAVEGVTLVVMNGAEAIAASEAVTVEGGVTTVNITVDRKLEKSTTLAITYNGETVASLTATVYDPTGIAALRAQYGQNVQIFTLSGKKVNDVRKGNVYIVNGNKVVIK